MKRKPVIGLALGSGAMRGLAHIGAIKVLQDNGIPISCVSGCSIGAFIGALYCSGTPFEYIIKILDYIRTKDLIDFSLTRRGLILGDKLEELLRVLIKPKTFEELKIPLSVVTTDIKSGEKVVIKSGNIVKAVRASISIPGVFIPVKIGERTLVDGGLIERLPVSSVRDMGADIAVGVDVGFKTGDNYMPSNIIDIIVQSIGIMELQILKSSIQRCDLLVRPNVSHLNPYEIENASKFILEGMNAMNEKIGALKQLIKESSNKSITDLAIGEY